MDSTLILQAIFTGERAVLRRWRLRCNVHHFFRREGGGRNTEPTSDASDVLWWRLVCARTSTSRCSTPPGHRARPRSRGGVGDTGGGEWRASADAGQNLPLMKGAGPHSSTPEPSRERLSRQISVVKVRKELSCNQEGGMVHYCGHHTTFSRMI